MKYQIDNLKISPFEDDRLSSIIKNKYQLNQFTFKILQKSIDARDKNNIYFIYKLMIDTDKRLKGKNISIYKEKNISLNYPKWKGLSPVIVGFGPAGMFAALYLARCDANPIIIERGSKIEIRKKDVKDFLEHKVLNSNSNVQFGEGGAGAFSDGKLVTNVKDPLISFILNELYLHGAKEEITYESKPHIGTDYLEIVVKNIRLEIEKLGGKFYFNHQFLNAKEDNDSLLVEVSDLPIIKTKHLLLGIGHSAKDTIKHLYNNMNIKMEQKAFSMGVRVEHPKKLIDEAQYGKFSEHLPSAYYKLACHNNNRGIYTFCMCPGGYVLASTSDEKTIVTNGMSNSSRDNFNSNSALLVEVKTSDFDNGSPLDGIYYQEKYEHLAYEISDDYKAPANLVKEFLNDEVASSLRTVKTTYPHGLKMADLSKCLPDYVIEGLKYGINDFDKKIKGFKHDDAILIGIESRSSSPVRILRDATGQSSMKGIYPIGEGAGYAGGITSAALDGLKMAMRIVGEFKNE